MHPLNFLVTVETKYLLNLSELLEKTSRTFNRQGLSPRQSAMVMASVVKVEGGDLEFQNLQNH